MATADDNLVVKLSKSGLEKAVGCAVCFEIPNLSKVLPCGHTLCHACPEQLDRKTCPLCHATFDVKALKSNVSLASLLEELKLDQAETLTCGDCKKRFPLALINDNHGWNEEEVGDTQGSYFENKGLKVCNSCQDLRISKLKNRIAEQLKELQSQERQVFELFEDISSHTRLSSTTTLDINNVKNMIDEYARLRERILNMHVVKLEKENNKKRYEMGHLSEKRERIQAEFAKAKNSKDVTALRWLQSDIVNVKEAMQQHSASFLENGNAEFGLPVAEFDEIRRRLTAMISQAKKTYESVRVE